MATFSPDTMPQGLYELWQDDPEVNRSTHADAADWGDLSPTGGFPLKSRFNYWLEGLGRFFLNSGNLFSIAAANHSLGAGPFLIAMFFAHTQEPTGVSPIIRVNDTDWQVEARHSSDRSYLMRSFDGAFTEHGRARDYFGAQCLKSSNLCMVAVGRNSDDEPILQFNETDYFDGIATIPQDLANATVIIEPQPNRLIVNQLMCYTGNKDKAFIDALYAQGRGTYRSQS